MTALSEVAETAAARLKARKQTIAVSESSAGGLISAALLAVPGASAYFIGGGVIYTHTARRALLPDAGNALDGVRSASEPYALWLAQTMRRHLGADWGLAETGAAGPTGNRYGDDPGHTCIAVSGSVDKVTTLETGSADRAENMTAFAVAAIDLLIDQLKDN